MVASLLILIYLTGVWHIKCDTPPITTEETAVAFMTEHPTFIDIKKESETILNLVRSLGFGDNHYDRENKRSKIGGELIARIEILIEEYPSLKNIKNKSEHCLNLLRKVIEGKFDRDYYANVGKLQAYVEIFVKAAIFNDKKLKEDTKKLGQVGEKCTYHEVLLGLQEDLNTYPIKYSPKDIPKIESITQEVQWIIALKTSDSLIVSEWKELIKKANFTIEEFAKIIATIHAYKSDIIHNIRVPEHCKTIDNYKKAIHDIPINGTLTEKQISAIDVLLNMKLVEKQNNVSGTSDSNSHNRCLVLQNFPFDIIYGPKEPNTTRHKQKIIHRKIHKHKLRAFLKLSTKEMDSIHYSELRWTSEKREATGDIIVMFTNPLEAARAFINYDKRVANTVHTLLVDCKKWGVFD